MPAGRPRTFDADEALDRALEVFWRQGYEGASLSDLTAAMGVNRPSLYATFGTKEQLFEKVLRRYAEVDMAYARAALDAPTAREAAEEFLRANAEALTRPDRPAGCFSIQGGLSCSAENRPIAELLASARLAGERAMADRFARAVREGDLPVGTDPADLARYLMVVSEGLAVHAAAGVGREGLRRAAEIALRAFPGPPPDRGTSAGRAR
jgi:AcrR family transcriptional regulator